MVKTVFAVVGLAMMVGQAADPVASLRGQLANCQRLVGEKEIVVDTVRGQIESGVLGDVKKVKSETLSALLKAIEKKNPQYKLDITTGEITVVPVKAEGK